MSQAPVLKQSLRGIHVWAIAVGLVISGEYFGWNFGWQAAGTLGFLYVTLAVTVMYITFIFSFTELTTAIPHAGGPFAYAHRAFGPLGGLVAGYATWIEFVLATPAIAAALGSYLHFLYPALPATGAAIGALVVFSGINVLGIRESARFSLFVTVLAVGELLIFIGIMSPHFSWTAFTTGASTVPQAGWLQALPFAIWFYLAIEGVAMVAEEVKHPRTTLPLAYIAGILTLVLLALGVMLAAGGTGRAADLATLDYPLPAALSFVLGEHNVLTKLFAGIGLFGLVASLHSIIISYSRQIFALARSGYLPKPLAALNTRFQTPYAAIVAGGVIGIIALLTGATDAIIVCSVMGALLMYIISLLSLFRLRKREPSLDRPFRTPGYPVVPMLALVMVLICFLITIWYNPITALVFAGGLMLSVVVYKVIHDKSKGTLHTILPE